MLLCPRVYVISYDIFLINISCITLLNDFAFLYDKVHYFEYENSLLHNWALSIILSLYLSKPRPKGHLVRLHTAGLWALCTLYHSWEHVYPFLCAASAHGCTLFWSSVGRLDLILLPRKDNSSNLWLHKYPILSSIPLNFTKQL